MKSKPAVLFILKLMLLSLGLKAVEEVTPDGDGVVERLTPCEQMESELKKVQGWQYEFAYQDKEKKVTKLKELESLFDKEMGNYSILQGIKDIKGDYKRSLENLRGTYSSYDDEIEKIKSAFLQTGKMVVMENMLKVSIPNLSSKSSALELSEKIIKELKANSHCEARDQRLQKGDICTGLDDSKGIFKGRFLPMVRGYSEAFVQLSKGDAKPEEVKQKLAEYSKVFKDDLDTDMIRFEYETLSKELNQVEFFDSKKVRKDKESPIGKYFVCVERYPLNSDEKCKLENEAVAKTFKGIKDKFLKTKLGSSAMSASFGKLFEQDGKSSLDVAALDLSNKAKDIFAQFSNLSSNEVFKLAEKQCQFQVARMGVRGESGECIATPKAVCDAMKTVASEACECDPADPKSMLSCLHKMPEDDRVLKTKLSESKKRLDELHDLIDEVKSDDKYQDSERVKTGLASRYLTSCKKGKESSQSAAKICDCENKAFSGIPGIDELKGTTIIPGLAEVNLSLVKKDQERKYIKSEKEFSEACSDPNLRKLAATSCQSARETTAQVAHWDKTYNQCQFDDNNQLVCYENDKKSGFEMLGGHVASSLVTTGLPMLMSSLTFDSNLDGMYNQAIFQKQYAYDVSIMEQNRFNAWLIGNGTGFWDSSGLYGNSVSPYLTSNFGYGNFSSMYFRP